MVEYLTMREKDKRLSLLFLLLPIAIIVNVFQFTRVRDEAGERWGAISSDNAENIFDDAIEETDNFSKTHNLYVRLGKRANNSTIVAQKEHPLEGDTLAGLVALGGISEVKTKSFDQSTVLAQLTQEQNLVEEGVYWQSLGAMRSGGPAVKWAFFSPDDRIHDAIFVEIPEENGAQWLFIDSRLLDDQLRQDLNL